MVNVVAGFLVRHEECIFRWLSQGKRWPALVLLAKPKRRHWLYTFGGVFFMRDEISRAVHRTFPTLVAPVGGGDR